MAADADAPRVVRGTFRAMGTEVTVLAHGAWTAVQTAALEAEVVDRAATVLEALEARWSRFRDDSDVCRLNAAAGRPVLVARETLDLVERAIDAWERTDGRYDPTILPALVAAGYDRDFADVLRASSRGVPDTRTPSPGAAPGCAGIAIDHTVGAITLPLDVAIDLGGIGKGRAADLVAPRLLDEVAGAVGVVVDLGGDLRVAGAPPRAEGWVVEMDAAHDGDSIGRLSLVEGAVATSTRLRRAWERAGRPVHHLIDPSTGEPAQRGLASVTVVAGSACRAEVLAKAAFVAGPADGAALLATERVTGVFVHDDGRVEELPGFAPFRT